MQQLQYSHIAWVEVAKKLLFSKLRWNQNPLLTTFKINSNNCLFSCFDTKKELYAKNMHVYMAWSLTDDRRELVYNQHGRSGGTDE